MTPTPRAKPGSPDPQGGRGGMSRGTSTTFRSSPANGGLQVVAGEGPRSGSRGRSGTTRGEGCKSRRPEVASKLRQGRTTGRVSDSVAQKAMERRVGRGPVGRWLSSRASAGYAEGRGCESPSSNWKDPTDPGRKGPNPLPRTGKRGRVGLPRAGAVDGKPKTRGRPSSDGRGTSSSSG